MPVSYNPYDFKTQFTTKLAQIEYLMPHSDSSICFCQHVTQPGTWASHCLWKLMVARWVAPVRTPKLKVWIPTLLYLHGVCSLYVMEIYQYMYLGEIASLYHRPVLSGKRSNSAPKFCEQLEDRWIAIYIYSYKQEIGSTSSIYLRSKYSLVKRPEYIDTFVVKLTVLFILNLEQCYSFSFISEMVVNFFLFKFIQNEV